MLRSFRLGTIGLIGFAISSSLQEQLASDGPATNVSGGFIREPRKHPHEPSRDNFFSMTINKYGFAARCRPMPLSSGRRWSGIPERPPY